MNKSSAPIRRKRELRDTLRRQRQALPAPARMAAAQAIVQHLQGHPGFARPGYVAGYWATDGELPLHVLQLNLRSDQVWCLPCIQTDGGLRFAPWRSGDALVSNRFGIPEPDIDPYSQLAAQDMTLILAPLLGFTRDGARLGMGGGFYDRCLAFRRNAPAPPWLIGVGYGIQEVESFHRHAFDVAMDAIVTEQELIDCAK